MAQKKGIEKKIARQDLLTIAEKLGRVFSKQPGFSLGIARHLSIENQNEFIVELVSNEALNSKV